MSKESDCQAMHFIENETQFHLGFLPTEQSSPLTRNLDREFASGSGNGVRCLQRVDRNVLEMAGRIFRDEAFRRLVESGKKTIADALVSQTPGKLCFPVIQQNADGILDVNDEYILKGQKLLLMEGKLLAEPSSCIGIGAVLEGLISFAHDDNVCFIITGGKVGFEQIERLKDVKF